MISLVQLLKEQESVQPAHFGTSTAGGQPLPSTSVDYNVSSDFSDFEARIARATAEAKASFIRNLNARVMGKKVSIQASKGYGQPIRDYEISVTSTSLDYFYDRYVVILRDEDDKEYFLKTGFKITILGQGEPLKPQVEKTPKKEKPKAAPGEKITSVPAQQPAAQAAPASAPAQQPRQA